MICNFSTSKDRKKWKLYLTPFQKSVVYHMSVHSLALFTESPKGKKVKYKFKWLCHFCGNSIRCFWAGWLFSYQICSSWMSFATVLEFPWMWLSTDHLVKNRYFTIIDGWCKILGECRQRLLAKLMLLSVGRFSDALGFVFKWNSLHSVLQLLTNVLLHELAATWNLG